MIIPFLIKQDYKRSKI